MNKPSESYLSVNYSLRPCKQVERRMLLDAFLLLAEAGYPVRDYRYMGMGSVHFVDFAMFHRYLGISSMLSVEYSTAIERRVRFNAPYQNAISVETGKPIGEFIEKLDRDKPYVLWLDYDSVLSEFMLKDLSLAATKLCAGSILLVTVDTEPPGTEQVGKHISKHYYDASTVRQYFEKVAEMYVRPNRGDDEFKYEDLYAVNLRAIMGAIKAGESGRHPDDPQFRPLFNFEYADGHRMLTAGGIILSGADYATLKKSRLGKTSYVRWNFADPPYRICVPSLSRREQLYLDQHMPIADGWKLDSFELNETAVHDYAQIYRFFPAYAELYM